MSGAVGTRKRLIRVTEGNLRNSHLYVADHLEFFPEDIVGPSRLTDPAEANDISIYLDGLRETIQTDVAIDTVTGRPRRMFRKRAWVRRFFDNHHLKAGDLLALEKIGQRDYRLYPFQAKEERSDDWKEWLDENHQTSGPTVIELFAGCGVMMGCMN